MYSDLCQEIEEQFQYEAEQDQAMADGKQKFSSTYNSAFDEITNQQEKISRIIDHQQHLTQISIIHTISFQSLVHKEFRPKLNDLDKLQWCTFVKI